MLHGGVLMGEIIRINTWKEKRGKKMESIFMVAAYLLSKESMNNKKLQKLCFYIQSWHLAWFNERMFDESFQAWVHGPVCVNLYHAYKYWGSMPIPKFTNLDSIILSDRSRAVIDSVYEAFGKFTAEQLEAFTHAEAPWQIARRGYRPSDYCNVIIDDNEMRNVCIQKMNAER